MASLDTSCLLRWLLGDVPEQTHAVQECLDQQGRVSLSDSALLEAVYVLEKLYKLTRQQIVLALGSVLGEAAFDFDASLWLDILSAYLSHPKLSIVDIYLVYRAEADGAGPVLTFDRKLATQLAGAELLGSPA
ncbi:MAG: PIN domain-containing protein [Propionibacteriaceae bacterium]|jgi:predicted nucleic-acid-binding protein|nr:PIN domain-containing protein [Propionibacteriaceae bacterium]